MWSDKKSIVLSKVCILAFVCAVLCVVVLAPLLVEWFFIITEQTLVGKQVFFFMTIYTGCVPALILLYNLYRLLQNIDTEQVFVASNVDCLRKISWSCFEGALICLISGIYYFPWVLIAIAAAFMGLIVRVVKNVVAQAVMLKMEADFTI